MSHRDGQQTKKAQITRQNIVAAARNMIGQRGAQSMSVMDVCAEANVGRTSFYNYFPDLQTLIETVAVDAILEAKQKFDKVHQEFPRGKARLKACFEMIFETAVTDRETTLLITSIAETTPQMTALIEVEIRNELDAILDSNSDEIEKRSNILTLSVLSLARQFALGSQERNATHDYVVLLLKLAV